MCCFQFSFDRNGSDAAQDPKARRTPSNNNNQSWDPSSFNTNLFIYLINWNGKQIVLLLLRKLVGRRVELLNQFHRNYNSDVLHQLKWYRKLFEFALMMSLLLANYCESVHFLVE